MYYQRRKIGFEKSLYTFSTTVKMIEHGQSVVLNLTKAVAWNKSEFPQRLMVWFSKGVTGHSWEGTLYHTRYIQEALPVARNYGNKVFGDNWTFQQDGAGAHVHRSSQQWCWENFPEFIAKEAIGQPDLNPLDYCVWKELVHAMQCEVETLIDELR